MPVGDEMSLKWPSRLTFVRHARSRYNELSAMRRQDEEYVGFEKLYDADPTSEACIQLARTIRPKWLLPFGDYSTELADGAEAEAVQTGRALCQERDNKIPDAVLVSPYIRTNGTYQALVKGWPDLAKSPMVEEERIREQEHGKLLAYGSRKIYFALKPDQRIQFDRQGEYWYRYPQGESVLDVRERNRSFIGMLIREHAGEDVLVVTHHLTILATRINLERRSWKDFALLDQHEKPINCGVTEYRGIPGAGRRGQGKIELVSSNRCLF